MNRDRLEQARSILAAESERGGRIRLGQDLKGFSYYLEAEGAGYVSLARKLIDAELRKPAEGWMPSDAIDISELSTSHGPHRGLTHLGCPFDPVELENVSTNETLLERAGTWIWVAVLVTIPVFWLIGIAASIVWAIKFAF